MLNRNVAIFHRLHQGPSLIKLPNAWDAASARLFENAGAQAIATSSAGLSWSLGYRDGRTMPADSAIAAASRIVKVLEVPLSFDIGEGYADEPALVARAVQRLANIGVAGINIEDGRGSPALLAAKIAAIRQALRDTRMDLFINARTDIFWNNTVTPATRLDEAIERARLYADAGADGLFVPGLRVLAQIEAVAAASTIPLNILALPGLPGAAELAAMGVRRLSAGPAIPQLVWGVAERAAKSFLAGGESMPELFDGAIRFGDMQDLFAEM